MSDGPSRVPPEAPPGAVPWTPRRQTPLYRALAAWLLRVEAWLQSHGGPRLRWSLRVFWAALAAIGVLLLVGPVINKPLSFDDIVSSAGEATDTWIARSFDASYTLQRDETGSLVVHVEERITALFPDDVDEDGVERIIATQYEGHDLRPAIREVTWDGVAVEPRVRHDATRMTIRVDAGERMRGDHDLVLRYDLHDLAAPTQDASSRAWYEQVQWDVFGPEWRHGSAKKSLTVTVPQELDGAFARQPTAGLSWLLLSDSTTLTPDETTAEGVVYRTDNDQNMPPYSSFWFALRFDSGTFTMPEPSALYWVQVVGPFVPLLLLVLAVPLVIAARRVAWADARGRPWFTMQEAPRVRGNPALDARLWRAWRTSALVDALAAGTRDPADARRLLRVARRTGRLGDLLGAWLHYRGARAYRTQFAEKLRRIPRGFVRDGFLGAALALTALQWGLVRQLSYQVALSEYWWPGAIVVVSTLLAVVVLAVALSARPLTRSGTRAVEHLRGQELFLHQTSARERTSLTDPLLPYIVMFAPARAAGRAVAGALEASGVADSVRADPRFVTGPRLLLRTTAIVVFLAACAVSFLTTASTRHGLDHFELLRDVDGDYGVYVSDVDISTDIVREGDGSVRMEVTESMTATVDANVRAVPQVTRIWRDRVDGHDQALTVESVEVDGAPVPFEQSRLKGYAFLQSRMPDDWPGEHDIRVTYTLADPASAVKSDGRWLDQIRWTALLPWWVETWEGVDHEPRHLAVSVRLPADLAGELTGESGWLDELPHRPVRPPTPFGSSVEQGGKVVIRFEADRAGQYEPGNEWPSASAYVGAQLRFPAGALGVTSHQEWTVDSLVVALPWILAPSLTVFAVGLSGVGIARSRRPGRWQEGGAFRDAVRWLPPWFTAAQFPLFGWAAADMYGDEPLFPLLLVCLGVSVVASVWVLVVTRPPRSAAARPAGRRG